jgi:hypothetical protein
MFRDEIRVSITRFSLVSASSSFLREQANAAFYLIRGIVTVYAFSTLQEH